MFIARNYLLLMLLFALCVKDAYTQTSQLPNDCANAITVCGNGMINSNAHGSGIQEIQNNVCQSFEHNSVWLKINIAKTGTLGFILRPTNTDIEVDYDFFVFGPNANCGNLGQAIRCSTTNPEAAGQTQNLTGMDGTSTDLFEGPGEDGDSFVKWLDVAVGETYFIVIDRPIGSGGFDLEWTGSATTGSSPFPEVPVAQKIDDQTICSVDGEHTFPLPPFANNINPDPSNKVAFYTSHADANDQINELTTSITLNNESQNIYARVTNANGCFDITDFQLSSYKNPEINNTSLVQCDLDVGNASDGKPTFNLNQAKGQITNDATHQAFYYETVPDRTNDVPISNPENFFGQDQQIIYTKVVSDKGCEAEGELTLIVNPTGSSLPKAGTFFTCDLDENDTVLEGYFNLNDIKKRAFPNTKVSLYLNLYDASIEQNALSEEITIQSTTLYARIEQNNKCLGVEEIDLIVDPKPKVILPGPLPVLCLNIGSLPITAPNGFDSYHWTKIDQNNNEMTIGTQRTIRITEAGTYRLELSYNHTDHGVDRECSSSNTFVIKESNTATISGIDIEDISDNNRIVIIAEGEGDYEYAIDSPYGPFKDENVFENVPKGFVDVYVRDKNGCGVVQKTISVVGYDRFFTPNGDGYNDYWKISGIDESFQTNSTVHIYNRYGKLIKQLNPLSRGWDGTFNGIPLPASDYWFSVTLQDGREFKGHFTLKR